MEALPQGRVGGSSRMVLNPGSSKLTKNLLYTPSIYTILNRGSSSSTKIWAYMVSKKVILNPGSLLRDQMLQVQTFVSIDEVEFVDRGFEHLNFVSSTIFIVWLVIRPAAKHFGHTI